MTELNLAIVGSTQFVSLAAESTARFVIKAVLHALQPEHFISGGAPGVDAWAEDEARQFFGHDHNLWIYKPANQRWEPAGFKERNTRIAEGCTHLLAIRCRQATTYGSGWTADYAEKLGKTVRRIYL